MGGTYEKGGGTWVGGAYENNDKYNPYQTPYVKNWVVKRLKNGMMSQFELNRICSIQIIKTWFYNSRERSSVLYYLHQVEPMKNGLIKVADAYGKGA